MENSKNTMTPERISEIAKLSAYSQVAKGECAKYTYRDIDQAFIQFPIGSTLDGGTVDMISPVNGMIKITFKFREEKPAQWYRFNSKQGILIKC